MARKKKPCPLLKLLLPLLKLRLLPLPLKPLPLKPLPLLLTQLLRLPLTLLPLPLLATNQQTEQEKTGLWAGFFSPVLQRGQMTRSRQCC